VAADRKFPPPLKEARATERSADAAIETGARPPAEDGRRAAARDIHNASNVRECS